MLYRMVHHRHRLETIHTGISMVEIRTTGVMVPVSRQAMVISATSRTAIAMTNSRVLLFVFVMRIGSFPVFGCGGVARCLSCFFLRFIIYGSANK